ILIFFLALILRICFILTLDNSVDVWGDWWDELGWKIASGQGYWVNNPYFPDGPKFYAWRSPGFPLFLALIYKIFGHSYFIAKIWLAVLSSLTCIFLYFIGKILVEKKIGLWSSLFCAIYPSSIFWTGYLAPETITTFLVVLSVLLILITENNDNNVWFLFIGFLTFGYLCITRPTFLILIPFIFLLSLVKYKKKILKKIGVMIISISIFPLLWGFRNLKVLNHFIITSTEGGIVFFIANNEYSLNSPSGFYHAENVEEFRNLTEVEIDKLLYKKTFDFIKKNPFTYIRLIFDRFIRYWRFYPHTISGPGESYKRIHQIISFISETPIIILGFLGIFKTFKYFQKWMLLYLLIFIYSGVNILIRTAIRYRFPVMPFLIIFAVYYLKNTKYGKKYF
ncbi:MAG: glycosyltransferase family 39 protein, partial [bacterium]|nr:glycosyltransferase family 39 protein [bacterium]MDW8163714.1 glycosyltransferase family 39 protein [Candidatus Omnitrophota bacterium]